MARIAPNTNEKGDLRVRAIEHLKGPGATADASSALGVLYELASSPSTAPNALALLHELQVHQVEVELQDEELRRSRVELETLLYRQVQLYENAPMGQLALDENAGIRELNQTAAALLGFGRDFLLGRSLDGLLGPGGSSALREMLGQATESASMAVADLFLPAARGAEARCLHASACLDPAGGGYLVGLMGVSGRKAPTDAS